MDRYLEQVISTIEKAIKRNKTSAARASTEAVGNYSMIRNMKAGNNPRLNNLKSLCDVLGLDLYIGLPEDYQELKTAAIAGTITGENVSSNYDLTKVNTDDLNDCEEIPAPVNKGSMIAFTVEDNDLFPAFSKGAMAFVDLGDRQARNQWRQFIGDICLLGLKNGSCLIRVLRRGDSDGLFNLESLAGKPTLSDQSPNLCLPVRWVRKTNG